MSADLKGKAIVVTGAAGGIGGACAEALAGLGSDLMLVDRARDRLDALSARLFLSKAHGRLCAYDLDVTSETDMSRMAERALSELGRIDALIAAAGLLRTGGQPRTIADTSFDEWKAVIDVNLTGTFLSNRAVLPAMIDQGRGDIVNFSSTSGRQGRAFDGAYCASKFGVIGFSESLAEEVSRLGVRVQTVLPDAVETPLWAQSGTASLKARDLLAPESVARFVVYLLSLPRDTYLFNPTVLPTRLRPRRKART